jgi:3-hydroxyisobutyrate dehydrogenase
MRVAMLGTGIMGAGMARSMHRAGLDVVAWNRTRAKAEALAEDGVAVADTVPEAVEGVEAVVTMLFDADAVLAVAPDVVAHLGPNSVWLQSSTVGIDGIGRIAERAGRAGRAQLLDAPVLGTKEPAEQGRLVPLVSGDPRLVDRVRPVLDAIGTKTVLAGERIGDGSALKLACNAWVLSLTAATAQSVALTRALGLDPRNFLEAIDGGPTNAPMAQLKGKAMMGGDFAPSFGLANGSKDLHLITDAADGIDRALLDGVRALFDAAVANGHGDDDIAAVYTSVLKS